MVIKTQQFLFLSLGFSPAASASDGTKIIFEILYMTGNAAFWSYIVVQSAQLLDSWENFKYLVICELITWEHKIVQHTDVLGRDKNRQSQATYQSFKIAY